MANGKWQRRGRERGLRLRLRAGLRGRERGLFGEGLGSDGWVGDGAVGGPEEFVDAHPADFQGGIPGVVDDVVGAVIWAGDDGMMAGAAD